MGTDTDGADTPTSVPEMLVPIVRRLVHKLIEGEYEDLIQSGVAYGWTPERLTAYITQMEHDDSAPLTDLPDAFFEKDDTTLALGGGRFSVWVGLWTTRGPSAYSLIIDFEPAPDGFKAYFENLEVM